MSLHLSKDLDALKQALLHMGGLAETAVIHAMQALTGRDPDLAQHVKRDDDELDRLEVEIDELAIQLLAKAPLASDLRLITASMRISQHLERVGDEATTIARRAHDLSLEPPIAFPEEFSPLLALVLDMLATALDAFVNQDADNARAVPGRDQEADRLHKEIQTKLIQRMLNRSDVITRALKLLTISKSLERIADHAANIAEIVVYRCEATDIRHTSRKAIV